MKRLQVLLLSAVCLSVILYSCGKTSINGTQDGNWYREVPPFQGPARSHAVSFVINQDGNGSGTAAYVGMGVDNYNTKYNDFYQATPSADSSISWTQVKSCPGVGRTDAVGFSVGGEGYVGLGVDSTSTNVLKDFYKYDSATNNWTQLNDFGGNARYLAVGFGIQNFGYVGTGYDGRFYYGDFWKYDPTNDTWVEWTTFKGFKRASAVSFVYGNRAFVVTGIGEAGSTVNDFYVFSPNTVTTTTISGTITQQADTWQRLNPVQNINPATFDDGYTNIMRSQAVAFVMTHVTSGINSGGNQAKAFLTCGTAGTSTWEYDIATDQWTVRTPYESAPVSFAVAFTIQNRGFVTTGLAGATGVSGTSEFFPDVVYNALD